MEIIIRTDGGETVLGPSAAEPSAATGTPSGSGAAGVPAELAAKASAIGANNAGAAPSSPGDTGVPPVNVAFSEEQAAPGQGAGESAGAAPPLI